MQWYIGCSGFYYKEWKELFYPKGLPQQQWFAYYCQHFNTLELNVTFYRFPELKLLQNWYQKAPPQFVFSAKVPQLITHQKKMEGTADILKEYYDVLSNGLSEKLGCVLFQLPPQLIYSEEKLNTIIAQLDPSFTNVIEFRHISWWRKEVMDILGRHGIVFCGASYPGLVSDVIINTPVCYYRFHGVPRLYYSSYDESFLQNVVTTIRQSNEVGKAYLYFNNTAAAAALDNAKYVQKLSAGWSQ
jgi:uncharacterized protein YecE (DUF72 family)